MTDEDRALLRALVYASLAYPIWQSQSFASWLVLLLLSLVGIFAGIGLRVQSFLWVGLVCFVLDVVYQLGRMGMDDTLAKWGIMLALGILLILFVALNEKKGLLAAMRDEHRRIYDAIAAGDPELARASASAHIASSDRWLKGRLAAAKSA